MKNFSLAKLIYSKKYVQKINNRITLLGSNCDINPITFLNVRFITSVLIFIISLILYDQYGYLLAPLLTLLYYFGLQYIVIEYRIKKRCKKLENEAETFFEVLTLSVESGNDLKQSIIITSKNVKSEISEEFKLAINETLYGKTLNEALKNLRNRIPSDNINNIILNISEASLFGGNIIDTLHNQIDFLQEKRIQYIKGEINKLPMKISIISVLFFIPLILLLILAPVLINLVY